MITTIITTEKEKGKKSFPKLMRGIKTGNIYLMTSERCGTYLTGTIGEYSKSLNIDTLIELDGEITLKNS